MNKKLIWHMVFRALIVVSSIVLQIYILYLIFNVFNNPLVLYALLLIVSIATTLYIILQDMKPDFKLSWIVSIWFMPFFGGLIYLMFGKRYVSKKEKDLYKQIENLRRETINNSKRTKVKIPEDINSKKQMEYLLEASNSYPYTNTQTKFYNIGEKAFNSMIKELEKAEKFIFLEYFIIEEGIMWNTIVDILEKKALEGVDVRVIYDDLGCIPFMPLGFANKLRKKGIKCITFNPVKHLVNSNFNYRDHRKICIIDGNVGFTGGMNIADNYINLKDIDMHWKDTAIRLKGEAVYSLTMMFLSMWTLVTGKLEIFENYAPTKTYKADGIIVPFTDTPIDSEPIAESLYKLMINSASEEINIISPYLAPGHDILTDLEIAAKAGTRIKLILPSITDNKYMHFLSRTYYEKLLKNGVEIYEYKKGFTHAKMMTCDNDKAIIGTINLNLRSFNLNYECAVWMKDSTAVLDIKKDLVDILEECEQITFDNLPKVKNKMIKMIGFAFMRIFSPLI